MACRYRSCVHRSNPSACIQSGCDIHESSFLSRAVPVIAIVLVMVTLINVGARATAKVLPGTEARLMSLVCVRGE